MPRIDLASQRTGRSAPRDVRTIHASVANVAVHPDADRLNPKLQGRERSLRGGLARRDLVHRHAVAIQIDPQGLADGRASEKAGCLDVVAVTR